MLVEEPSINYGQGWIKAFRSLQNKGWYADSHYVHLWIHILFKANHEGKEWLYKGKVQKVERGQFITSRDSLVKETGINRSKIERILLCFESEQQIEQQNLHTSRLISILNYESYQSGEQPVSSKRAASEQPVSTTKELKNIRSKEEYIVSFKDFVKKYPGTKRGVETEFKDFIKHKDWEGVAPVLMDVLNRQIKNRDNAIGFVPPWKNLKTWINQRCWEEAMPEVEDKNISLQRPVGSYDKLYMEDGV